MRRGLRGPLVALVAASVIFSSLVRQSFTPAAATTRPASVPISVTSCSTAQLSDIIAVYLNTPGAQTAPVPIPAGTRSFLAHVLRARLQRCARAFAAPLARGACTPPKNENDVRRLWTQLEFCVSLNRRPTTGPSSATSPPSSGIEWELPARSGAGHRPVLFVIGIGDDRAMVAKLVSTLSVYLNDGRDEAGYYFSGDAVLVPEPAWSPSDYVAQCQSSPQVRGAIVVDVTAAGSGAADEFFRRRNWTAIEATALYAQCMRGGRNAHGVPAFVWVSDMAMTQRQRITLTPLTPLATLLMLGAAYEEFAPARETSVSTAHVYPVPSPIPSGGYTSQVDTSHTTSYNAAGLAEVAATVLSGAGNAASAATPLSLQPTIDQQTWNTLQSLAIELVKDMNCWQPEPTSIGRPTAHDVIGTARILPAYNPPAGLGSFVPGETSAPFCAPPSDSESIDDILPTAPRLRR